MRKKVGFCLIVSPVITIFILLGFWEWWIPVTILFAVGLPILGSIFLEKDKLWRRRYR